jgi:hypothetical protein
LDLIEAGTSAATDASAPEGAAGVDVAPALDDEVVLDDELELLLPHPTITAALTRATSTAGMPLHLFMALLLSEPQFRQG